MPPPLRIDNGSHLFGRLFAPPGNRDPMSHRDSRTMNSQVSHASGGRLAQLFPRPQDQGDGGPPGTKCPRSPGATDFRSPHTFQLGDTDKDPPCRFPSTAATGTPPARVMAICRKRLSVSPPRAAEFCFNCFCFRPRRARFRLTAGNEKRAIRARIARCQYAPVGLSIKRRQFRSVGVKRKHLLPRLRTTTPRLGSWTSSGSGGSRPK